MAINDENVRIYTPHSEDVVLYHPGDFSLGDVESARLVGPKVVVVGGGTGLSTMLKGLRDCTENITAVVTVADDGGGSGVLRDEMGMLPPGDIRNCIMALANAEPTMAQVLNYRFSEGSLAGQSFGNLFIAALERVSGSFVEAVRRMSEVLAITGRVLPVTTENVVLRAELENGHTVVGESKVHDFKLAEHAKIKRMTLEPSDVKPLDDVLETIADADMIVLGPGSLYTSIIPNLLVDGVADAIARAKAMKVYVCNVMTQEGETEGLSAADHLRAIVDHAGGQVVDVCLANCAIPPEDVIEKYKEEGAGPVVANAEEIESLGAQLERRDLLRRGGDYARHDPRKLAAALADIHARRNPRRGIYGRYDRLMAEWLASRAAEEE